MYVHVCVCACLCVQFYSSELNNLKEKKSSSKESEGDSPVNFLKELLEEAIQPNLKEESSSSVTDSGYSTSYCWPPLLNNSTTLGLHRHHPAQSCEHILNVNVTASNGFYWIDPNLGCSSDSILAYCNFTSNETCIHPNLTQVIYTIHSMVSSNNIAY